MAILQSEVLKSLKSLALILEQDADLQNAKSLLVLLLDTKPLDPISTAKYFMVKSVFCKSMTSGVYLWHLNSWLRLMLFSYGTVNSNIQMFFVARFTITRSGRSDVGRISGGIVHGEPPASQLI